MNQQLVNMTFSKYMLNKPMTLQESLKLLWTMNLVNVGEMAERAITRSGKLTQNSRGTKGSDFNDKSDSKYVTVYHYKTSYASVNFKHKIGKLRVCCFEPKTKKNYYFIIPHKVYAPFQKNNDSLKIWFTSNGLPRNPIRNNRENLWDYQCSESDWAGGK